MAARKDRFVSASIVRVVTKEEQAYVRALLEIEARRQTVASLQDELGTLSHSLKVFAAEAHLRLASLFAELDYVRRAINLCERRISRLRGHARPNRPNPEPEDPDLTNAEAAFGPAQGESSAEAAAEAAEIKRLYLDLARRYHPDLARSEEDRHRREEMMLRVNEAFHARDLALLTLLQRDAEAADGPDGLKTTADRLRWALREIERLEGVITDLSLELANLRTSESGRLWQRQQAGEQVFDRLSADLRVELTRQRTRLADLTDIQNGIANRARRTARRA